MSEKNNDNTNGGYMRNLHTVESKLYAPEMKLNGSEFKIILYIRHNSIRWDKEKNQFSYGEISKATGVEERQAKRLIKRLIAKGLLVLIKPESKKGEVPEKNFMGLSQQYFGELIDQTSKPKFTVHNGGKLSQKKADLSTGVANCPPSSVVDLPSQPVVTLPPEGGVNNHPLPHQEAQSERLPSTLKNPLKEPEKTKILKNVPEILNPEIRNPEESFTLSGTETEKEAMQKSKEFLDRKFPFGIHGLLKSL